MKTAEEKREYHKRYYQENREKWVINTPEKRMKRNARGKVYWKLRDEAAIQKEAKRTAIRNASQEVKDRKRRWYLENRERLLEIGRERRRLRMQKQNATLAGRVLNRLRSRLWKALKRPNTRKTTRTVELVGCSADDLIIHLQSLFLEGMTLEKLYDGSIEIDHIKPCALFDLTKEDEQRKCFHFSNLQPLWMIDNRRKRHHYATTATTTTTI